MLMTSRKNVALLLVLALLTAIFLFYTPTFRSMVSVWSGSNNYLHGVLILPLSAFLIWQKRALWMRASVKPSIVGMLLLLMSVLVWITASLVSVQLVSQLAFVAMIGTIIWTVLGTDVSRVIRFPLLYAFLAVPFGAFLIPTLMDWTAFFTVRALQITGIPVLREGHYFSLPSGNFEVIEACSGIRFLLVTVVLGLYFAHSAYRSWGKRAAFLAFAAITIIIANWIRAYFVVLSAHLTDMKSVSGQRHIYLGWVVFLLVIGFVFWIGRRFEDIDEQPVSASNDPAAPVCQGEERRSRSDVIIVSVLAFVVLASGSILLDIGRDRNAGDLPLPTLPMATGEWSGPNPVSSGYRPAFVGASSAPAGQYSDGSQVVELHLVFYSEQQQGDELIGWQSKLFDADSWRQLRRQAVSIEPLSREEGISVQSVLITNGKQRLLLWYWYDIGGAITSNPRTAKLRQAWDIVTGNRKGDALIVLVTPAAGNDLDPDGRNLKRFVSDNFAGVSRCLRPAATDDNVCTPQTAQDSLGEEY